MTNHITNKIDVLQITEKVKFSRRGTVRHKTNPFLLKAIANTKIGSKRLSNASGDKLMIVSETTGEIVAPAGFHEILEVDKTQFVKLFKNGVKAFTNLTNSGARVFSVLYDEMQNNIGKDFIYLSYSEINKDIEPMSEATFYRGMKELLEHNFIAETVTVGKYFVNPDFVFNGNRLAFIREFRVKERKNSARNKQNLSLFDNYDDNHDDII